LETNSLQADNLGAVLPRALFGISWAVMGFCPDRPAHAAFEIAGMLIRKCPSKIQSNHPINIDAACKAFSSSWAPVFHVIAPQRLLIAISAEGTLHHFKQS
jgi:hypothetical protein